MFASQEIIVHLPYEVASARLAHLTNRGVLHSVSETAYQSGWQMLVRVGPFGDLPGLSKLVRVRMLAPVRHEAAQTVSLRWEATGPAGELFPVLDADLTLNASDQDRSRLVLLGSYRPPLGRAGAAMDRAIMNRVATATLRSLLDNVAGLLTESTAYQNTAPEAVPWRPVAEPGHA
jgi:hypothetical protein